MSLYEKYFSKINEEHMFKLIKKIIIEDTGINIETNEIFKNIFKERYPLIFEENDMETLIELNKLLIDDICNRIINQNNSMPINSIPINSIVEEQPIKQLESVKESELLIIKSSKRNRGSSNRFNYKIDCDSCSLQINKLVIPYEKNEIFINDNVLIKINNVEVHCQLKSKNNVEDREYFTYEPYIKMHIDITDGVHIKIMNELEIEIKEKDIYEVSMTKNIKLKEKEYLCIGDDKLKDIEKNDKLGLIKDEEIKDIVRVLYTTEEYCLCDKKEVLFDSIINLSLQNTIYCEVF